MKNLSVGLKGEQKEIVSESLTAKHLGSGNVKVYATPMMISLMERTSRLSVKPFLDENEETVGTVVNVRHLASAPIGAEVTCRSVLEKIEGRRLTFRVEVREGEKVIGEGGHERFVIDIARFAAKNEAAGSGKENKK